VSTCPSRLVFEKFHFSLSRFDFALGPPLNDAVKEQWVRAKDATRRDAMTTPTRDGAVYRAYFDPTREGASLSSTRRARVAWGSMTGERSPGVRGVWGSVSVLCAFAARRG